MEWQARQPRVSKSSFPCEALPGFCLGIGSARADCHKYAEMDWICASLKRKSGILVVARKPLGFFSQIGIQLRLSLRRMSLRLGSNFLTSCRRLLVVRSS